MNMFKPVDAKTVGEYMTALEPERRKILETLDKLIKETAPSLKSNFIYNMPGYGAFDYLNNKKEKLQWPVVSIASQKNYVSFYVCSVMEDGQYVAEKFKDKLGKVNVGRSCIRFKKLEDINLDVLAEVIKIAAKNPGLEYATNKKKK